MGRPVQGDAAATWKLTVRLDPELRGGMAKRAAQRGDASLSAYVKRLVEADLATGLDWVSETPVPRRPRWSLAQAGTVPKLPASELVEEGRRLASRREDLTAQGVPPQQLAVPKAGCAHQNIRYRLGRRLCVDCGEWL